MTDLHWIPSVKFQSLAANLMSGVFSYILLRLYGHLSDPSMRLVDLGSLKLVQYESFSLKLEESFKTRTELTISTLLPKSNWKYLFG